MILRALGLLVASSFLAGCTAHARIDAKHDAMLAETDAQARSSMLYVRCADGAAIRPDCGSLLRRTAEEDFRGKFRARFCEGKSDEDCQAAYERMIHAALRKRYSAADFAAVAATCDVTPGACDDPLAYERLLARSHNEGVQREFGAAEADIERSRHRAKVAADAQTEALVVGAFAVADVALNDRPRCLTTPSVFGSVWVTRCR